MVTQVHTTVAVEAARAVEEATAALEALVESLSITPYTPFLKPDDYDESTLYWLGHHFARKCKLTNTDREFGIEMGHCLLEFLNEETPRPTPGFIQQIKQHLPIVNGSAFIARSFRELFNSFIRDHLSELLDSIYRTLHTALNYDNPSYDVYIKERDDLKHPQASILETDPAKLLLAANTMFVQRLATTNRLNHTAAATAA